MKSFKEFIFICEEVEDKSKALGFQATIRKQNQDGRVGRDRRITDPERRRENPYKPRKDIGTQKQASTRVQQPEQERGSAALSPKESARKAYLERKDREAGKKTPTANELLSKSKPPKPAPEYTPPKPSDYSEKERKALYKKGERALRDVVLDATGKKSEKELKHKYTSK